MYKRTKIRSILQMFYERPSFASKPQGLRGPWSGPVENSNLPHCCSQADNTKQESAQKTTDITIQQRSQLSDLLAVKYNWSHPVW